MLLLSFPNDGRKLRQFINGLLKSQSATEIKRLNYIKSYTLIEGKIHKEEEKTLLIDFLPENQKKLEQMIKKLHPNKEISWTFLEKRN